MQFFLRKESKLSQQDQYTESNSLGIMADGKYKGSKAYSRKLTPRYFFFHSAFNQFNLHG